MCVCVCVCVCVHRLIDFKANQITQVDKTFSMRKLVVYIGFEGIGGVKRKDTRSYQKG